MPDQHPARPDTGVVVEEARPQVKQPPLYQVVLLNDDYTPMEFVVDVLEKFFSSGPSDRDAHHAGGPYQG